MKRRTIAIFFALAATMTTQAQTVLSLDECRQLALRGNKELAIGNAKAEQAQWTRKAAHTNFLPKVALTAGYMRTGDEISLLSKDQKSALNNLGTNGVGQFASVAQQIVTKYPDLAPLLQNMQGLLPQFAQAGNSLGRGLTDGERIKIKSGALVDKDYFKTFGAIGDKHLENDRQIYFKLFNINEKEEMDKIKCESKSLLEEGLTLPENVYIIGTVNMDDTTHQFSRKVIDRAMTIEMNGGALEDIFKDEDELTYSESPLTMDSLRNKYVTAKEVIKKCDAVAADEQISNYIQGKTGKGLPQRLQSINMVLSGTPFTVSYRVMNELTLYLAVLLDKAEEDGKEVTFDTFIPYVETAIDKILLMKILPRVEGDDEMFRISEKERRVNELDSQVNDEDDMSHEFTKLDWLKQIAPQHTEDNKEEYMAVDKLSEMIDRLNRQSFTRYWP